MNRDEHHASQNRKSAPRVLTGVKILLFAKLLILLLTISPMMAVAADSNWETVDIGTTETLGGIWGADDDNIWVISRNNVIHYEGKADRKYKPPYLTSARVSQLRI